MLRFRHDLVRLEVPEPADFAPRQVHLSPGEIGRRDDLREFLVDFLDREPRLRQFAFESGNVEFVITGIDFEEERARLDELPLVAGD